MKTYYARHLMGALAVDASELQQLPRFFRMR
jgi:hypothetical protein